MKKENLTTIITALAFCACTDDLPLTERQQGEVGNMLFTASIAQQDFYGTESKTRAANLSEGFYDLAIEGNNELKLAVSTVGGIFGKANDFADKGVDEACQGGVTRGAMLTELRQEPMLVLETSRNSSGTTVGEPYKAVTSDGVSWNGSHVVDNGKAILRTLNAFYPYRETYKLDAQNQQLSYTVPEAATEQCDLLYARHEQGFASVQSDSLHLTFNHLLTAVRFKVGRQELPMSVIKRIEISGIHDQGSFDCNTNSWTVNSSTGSATATLDFNVTGMSNTVINSGENTFMLMPQTLPSGAKVTVYYTDNSQEEQQFTAMLSSSTHTTVWQPGKSITYTLMTQAENSEYVLEVEQPEPFTHEGGTHNINILSYKRQGDVITPVKWGIQSYSGDGGKTWMDGGNANPVKGLALSVGEGYSDKPMLVGVTLAPAEEMTDVPHSEILRYTPALGQDGDAFDLSTHDYLNQPCAQTTANCYVVDAPGTYRFPTAYGNGIVNGKTNSAAYANTIDWTYTTEFGQTFSSPETFVDYKGQKINAPMIQQSNGRKISRAALVWQDSEDLIRPEDIQLIDGGNAIQFTIRPENIAQGNATIAALDGSNTVMWSWHIWVTDEKARLETNTFPVTNASGEVNYFMPLNIGWCSTANATGAVGRELAVRITQPDEALNNRASFRILQHSMTAIDNKNNTQGNSTFYNWGRKDPFPGAEQNYHVLGIDYDISDNTPKRFYQAGSEAGTLGLHAEMHVEYGPNWGQAFVAGAMLGINGYLTGFSVGRLFSSLHRVLFAPTLERGSEVSLKGSFNAIKLNFETQGAKVGTIMLSNGELVDCVTYSDGYQAAIEEVLLPEFDDLNEKLIIGWGKGYLLTPLKFPTAATTFCIGNYAAVYVPSVAFGLAKTVGSDILYAAMNGSSMFSGDGDWLYEIKEHGCSVEYAIQHPNVLMRNPIAWANNSLRHLWNVTQDSKDSRDEKVTKTIYDPSPAGYCVPNSNAFSAFDDNSTGVGANAGLHYSPNDEYLWADNPQDKTFYLPALGVRQFWNGCQVGETTTNDINTLIMFSGDQGFYWTASPAIEEENAREGGYALNFKTSENYSDVGGKTVYSPRVENAMKLQTSFAMPVRPVKEVSK